MQASGLQGLGSECQPGGVRSLILSVDKYLYDIKITSSYIEKSKYIYIYICMYVCT